VVIIYLTVESNSTPTEKSSSKASQPIISRQLSLVVQTSEGEESTANKECNMDVEEEKNCELANDLLSRFEKLGHGLFLSSWY